jgi:integrase
MARTSRSNRLDSRTARLKLTPRREPYWHSIEAGFAIGYRRMAGKGGTWIAKRYTSGQGRDIKSCGVGDDFADADGIRVLSFAQAQSAARKWLADLSRAEAGGLDRSKSHTVGCALDAYLTDYKTRGGRAEKELRRTIDVLIRPVLGSTRLDKLSHLDVKGFRDALALSGRRLRSKSGEDAKVEEFTKGDSEQRRKRRATANRVFTTLRAALNFAHQNQMIASNAAWAGVKPFENTDAPRVRYLLDDEALRLVNACPPDMRSLATGALLTGCRYGELVRMRVADFNDDNGSIHIPITKSGKPRDIVLTDEGREFVARLADGKSAAALVFVRANGQLWKAAEQTRPLRAACKAARISPAVSFHILRHTYASRLARAGVPMAVIAAQLGHSDLRVTSRHYAHLSPGYVADTVRAAFGSMGLVETQPGNVVSIDGARTTQPARGGSANVVNIRNER